MIRIAYFTNQFYAGIGGEDKADEPFGFVEGPKGPAVGIQGLLKDKAEVVVTLWAGDNYAMEKTDECLARALDTLKQYKPDVLIAGPSFNSGRFGLSCGQLLKAASETLGIPGVGGLGPDNPAIAAYRKYAWFVPVGLSAASMKQHLPQMAALAVKLGSGEKLGPADEDGYIPRGYRINTPVGVGAAKRALDMAVARLAGREWTTEVPIVPYSKCPPPPPVESLKKATIALVTEAGLVPSGNPDHLETWNATKWFTYPLGNKFFEPGNYEAWHGGFVTDWVNADPNRNLPYDALKRLEEEGVIGKAHEEYCVTCANMSNVDSMDRIGGEMGEYLKSKGVDGVILTAT